MTEATGERLVVALAERLREHGVTVDVGSVLVFARSLSRVDLARPAAVYYAGRATLVHREEDLAAYDAAFSSLTLSPVALEPLVATETVTSEGDPSGSGVSAPSSGRRRGAYSPLESLRRRDFAAYTREEWDEASRLISELSLLGATRVSRRCRPRDTGGRLDLGATVRRALNTGGEPVEQVFARPSRRRRRVVFVIDVSGSMVPYARAFLRLCHAALLARPRGEVDVFVYGTRLSRVTRELRQRDADVAFRSMSLVVEDFYGGTRLGDALHVFNSSFGARGLARGATVVIVSDGWDRGAPDLVSSEMARLGHLAHRVVWVNPHKSSPGYTPTARGMAAALPYVDDFVEGNSIEALETLVGLLASATGRRSERRYDRKANRERGA